MAVVTVDQTKSDGFEPLLSLVCPVYNEATQIPFFVSSVREELQSLPYSFELVFVDDGSTDETWKVIQAQREDFKQIRSIRLARNYGKETALTAGLSWAEGRAHIPIDVDLQDPLDLIPKMVESWLGGYKHVVARRESRADGLLRNFASLSFHNLVFWLSDGAVPKNVGDFRLLDRSLTNRFLKFPEKRRVNKVLFSLVGGPTDVLGFRRPPGPREATRMSAEKLRLIATDAITSNTDRLASLGLSVGLLAFLGLFPIGTGLVLIWGLGFLEVPGQATTLMVGAVLFSAQAVGFSFITLVLAQLLSETKLRPAYFIDEVSGYRGQGNLDGEMPSLD